MDGFAGSPQNDEPEAPKGDTQTPDPVGEAARSVIAERAADAAADPPRRPRGRPRGSKTRNRRDRRARPAPRERAPEPEREPEPIPEPTPAELAGIGNLCGAVWRIVGGRLRRRPLTESEQAELAEAAHPVMVKYGGAALEQWGAEIGLALVVWGLWNQTALPDDSLEVPSDLIGGGQP